MFMLRLLQTLFVIFSLVTVTCHARHPGLDNSFGVGGHTSVATPNFSPRIWTSGANYGTMDAHAASDGRLTVIGYGWGTFALARLISDGVFDPGFNAGAAKIVSTVTEIFSASAVDSQGRALVASYVYDTSRTVVIVYRFTAAGEFDSSFGTNGRKEITLPVVVASNSVVPVAPRSITLRSDGGFFVTLEQAAVVAFADDGEMDTSLWDQGVYYAQTLPTGANSVSQARS
jgi:hypothetical protein